MNDLLELFFEVVDDSITYMKEYVDKDYFDLLLISLEDISNCEVNDMFYDEQFDYLNGSYLKLQDKDFQVDDVRKACELLLLKAFKELGLKNVITPSSIGMFIAYLISRFNKDNKNKINILDPVVGSGNLLYTICNHLDIEKEVFGIDIDERLIKVCKVIANLVQQEISLYLQDTFSINIPNMDFIVCDLLNYKMKDDLYFPFEIVRHHSKSLKEDGYLICLTLDDFFNQDKNKKFKEEILQTLSIVGIIELPDGLFLGQAKSIIVFKKAQIDHKKCLMVKLPSFNDVKEFNKTLFTIETWFENNL